MRKKILMSLASLSVLVLLGAGAARAQVVDEVEANIPFSFHAGEARLPAGKYFIRMLDDSDLSVMEISSANDRTAALFEVRNSEANTSPGESELQFNKYGNQYFLSKIFEQGDKYGSAVEGSRYETRMENGMKPEIRAVKCRRTGRSMKKARSNHHV